jgi:integrase/recombinase XerD
MLRTLFPRYHIRYEQSSYASELESFARWLQATGYSRHNVRVHVRCLRRALEKRRQASGTHRYAARACRAVFSGPFTSPGAQIGARATERLFRRFLESQGRLIPSRQRDARYTSELGRYRDYLTEVRGFARPTVAQHLTTVADFLRRALGPTRPLGALTMEHVEQYVARRAPELCRQSLQHIVAHLRGLVRYCVMRRLIHRRLTPIDTPRTYRGERPPRALPWPMVERLLHSIDRDSRAGWRDYAILHLMAHYGLRPSEVVSLDLDSIDWDAQTLRVEQRKTRSTLMLPLAPRTVSLLRRYLAIGRPTSGHPQLFLRARDPAGPLKPTAICDVFGKRASAIGLPLDRYSAYSLRHGFAVRLLDRGVGIKAIGDLLGHRQMESTQVYLRLETEKLRTIALPVPRPPQARRGV